MNGFATLLAIRWRATLNLGRVLRGQSTFKQLFILFFAIGLIAGLWGLFYEGFRFLDRLGGLGLILVPRLFALFFFGLSLMLVLSSVFTTYASLFRSDEIPFLMLHPVSLSEMILFKLLESAFYASWAFFFIIVPFVGAYAMYERLPWYFSLWTLLFSIPFVLLCSAIGFVVTLVFVRWVPRGRLVGWTLAGAALAAAILWWTLTGRRGAHDEQAAIVLTRLIPGLKTATHPLSPGWWISEGIVSFARAQWTRGLCFWGVILSNALALGLLAESLGRRVFYDAWQRVLSAENRVRRNAVMLGRLDSFLRPLPSDVRCMILKDIRIFLRDPQQWMQALIFCGLLGIYFLNLRNFHYHMLDPQWRNLIAFLNVFSTSAVLCSLGSRFVYPQMSLEGQAFWVVGMTPTSMRRVLLAKFLLAAAAMLSVSVGLMLISVRMLDVEPLTRALTIGIAAAVAVAVAGLSTGLGAIFLDLDQRNPAAIVSGFGGTLNLVLSLGFLLVTIFPLGAMFHLHSMGVIARAHLDRGVWIGAILLALLTALAALLPLALAQRSLTRREY